MSVVHFAVLSAALIASICPQAAMAKEKLLWAALDFPPFQVRDGDFRGSGSFDGLMELLIEQLPAYEHEVLTMNFARREDEFRQGEKMCTPGLFRTSEREKYLTFSAPALIHLDNRVVYMTSKAARFKGAGPIDLQELFKRTDLVGGIISNRSFAPNIDPLVQRYLNQPNVVTRAVKSSQMFEMLSQGEIDYTIMFPHEAAFLARQFGRPNDIVTRPITGTPAYSMTAVACTKGAWGNAIIARIDGILKQQRETSRYRALSERWYEGGDRALIKKYYPNLLQ